MSARPLLHALLFVAAALLLQYAGLPLLYGLLHGLPHGLLDGNALLAGFGLLASLALLLLSWLALRLEGLSLATLGLAPTRWREFGIGFIAAALVFAAIALVKAWMLGLSWQFHGLQGLQAALLALPLALLLLLPEELLFRGYALRKLSASLGDWPALLLSALTFGAYHLAGSRGDDGAAVFLMPMLGGLLFGIALLRSGGLALPIGLHLGGNWVQAGLLSLGCRGEQALACAPLPPQALTIPPWLLQLPYLLGLALLLLLALKRWR